VQQHDGAGWWGVPLPDNPHEDPEGTPRGAPHPGASAGPWTVDALFSRSAGRDQSARVVAPKPSRRAITPNATRASRNTWREMPSAAASA
jgi:hypothetical protein